MAILPANIFLLPIPSILYLVPPSHFSQWVIRCCFLIYAILFAIPLILILAPISVILSSAHPPHLKRLAPLPIHPDNLPPRIPYLAAIPRAILVYSVQVTLWSITGIGNAPDMEGQSSWFVYLTLKLMNLVGSSDRQLYVEAVVVPRVPDDLCHGVLSMEGVERVERPGFWLRRNRPKESLRQAMNGAPEIRNGGLHDLHREEHVIIFLAGGGYVTGPTLGHPFIFSLMRRLTPPTRVGYSLFAPSLRKSLDPARSFPISLLDALAAFCYLRECGYAAGKITLMGDSAGGGLCWSLMALLVVLEEKGLGLGLPSGAALISPWLALPPCGRQMYPDLVNEPMLLNAARCYLARFPILKHRPDPFRSDLGIWITKAYDGLQRFSVHLQGLLSLNSLSRGKANGIAQEVLQPDEKRMEHQTSMQSYLGVDSFTDLTSHHPLISPATDSDSPFVTSIFQILCERRTKLLVHSGSAEWFFEPVKAFARAASAAGVDVDVAVEKGGFHTEACIFPGEWGGKSAHLVDTLVEWLKEGTPRL